MHTFRDLATAAYCPRKLYYRRRDPDADTDLPEEIQRCRALAFRYDRLLDSDPDLLAAPIELSPTAYRSRLGQLKARRDDWDDIVDPTERDRHVEGQDARGVVHKVLTDPLRPSLVFTGEPPEQGVWEPQTVRLVAAAKALAWEHETEIETALAEYPAYGVIREVPLTTRRKATYREAVRTADAIDGPPSKTTNRTKCSPCEYQSKCGVATRSLRSLL
jgi:CRISPR-associated exonuclease Cas4